MAISEHLSGIDVVPSAKTAASPSSLLKSLAQHVMTWAKTCADYYAAAAMYERLSNLSNAELHRRGLSRDRLARHIFESCNGTADHRGATTTSS
jgi:hypothetical protein